MSRKEEIRIWRNELVNQQSKKMGDSPVDPSESIFSDEVVAFAIDLDLCIA